MRTSYITYLIIAIVAVILVISALPEGGKENTKKEGEKIGNSVQAPNESQKNEEDTKKKINDSFSVKTLCVDDAKTAFGVKGGREEVKIEGLVEIPSFTYEAYRSAEIDEENHILSVSYLFQKKGMPSRIRSNCTAAHAPIKHNIQLEDGNWTLRIRNYIDKEKTLDIIRQFRIGEVKETTETEKCEEDVGIAQKFAEDSVCTQQIQEMTCPHKSDFTYRAKNGCEISGLKEQGWNKTE